MRKLSLLLAIVFFTLTGCAAAGQPTNQPIDDAQNVAVRIQELTEKAHDAAKILESNPEWVAYKNELNKFQKLKNDFIAAKKKFLAIDKKARELREYVDMMKYHTEIELLKAREEYKKYNK